MATRKTLVTGSPKPPPPPAPKPPFVPRTKAEWSAKMDEQRVQIEKLGALTVAAKDNLDEMVRQHNNAES